MFEDANEQLEQIHPSNRTIPEIIALGVAIYNGLEKWELMREGACRLHEVAPDNGRWVICHAYAARRAESITAAKNILIHSLDTFSDEGSMYYNLACYDSVLGDFDSAKDYLKQAFVIDPNLRLLALEDEDLKLLWDYLGGLNKGHQLESPLLDSFEK